MSASRLPDNREAHGGYLLRTIVLNDNGSTWLAVLIVTFQTHAVVSLISLHASIFSSSELNHEDDYFVVYLYSQAKISLSTLQLFFVPSFLTFLRIASH